MNPEIAHLLGMTGRGTGNGAPAPTEESIAEWSRLYDEAASLNDLARRLGRSPGTIRYHLLRHGIATKRSGFKSPKSVRHHGQDHANWRGGTYRHSQGYIYEMSPDHPEASKAKGYVLQHRLVMERHLGRYLTADEIVHHRNDVKDDNRLANLELVSRSRHMKRHKAVSGRDSQGRFA